MCGSHRPADRDRRRPLSAGARADGGDHRRHGSEVAMRAKRAISAGLAALAALALGADAQTLTDPGDPRRAREHDTQLRARRRRPDGPAGAAAPCQARARHQDQQLGACRVLPQGAHAGIPHGRDRAAEIHEAHRLGGDRIDDRRRDAQPRRGDPRPRSQARRRGLRRSHRRLQLVPHRARPRLRGSSRCRKPRASPTRSSRRRSGTAGSVIARRARPKCDNRSLVAADRPVA